MVLFHRGKDTNPFRKQIEVGEVRQGREPHMSLKACPASVKMINSNGVRTVGAWFVV